MKVLRSSYLLFAILLPSLLQAASPVADAGDDITIADFDGDESVTVVLDASATTDADGDIAGYEWTWAGGSATGEVTEGTFPASGVPVTVTLTVSDDALNESTDTLDVSVYKKDRVFIDFPSTTTAGKVSGNTFATGNVAYRLEAGSWVPQALSGVNFSEVVDPDTIFTYSPFTGSNFLVFRYDGNNWIESTITVDTPPPAGGFAEYAFSSDTVVIGNREISENGNNSSGKVVVYDWVGDNFNFAQELVNPNFPAGFYEGAQAGYRVDVEGDLIIVTRRPEVGFGLLYDLYRKTAGTWTYETTLGDSDQFSWFDADIENGVILAERNSPQAMVILEYDAVNGWEETEITPTEPVVVQYFGYKLNDDGNSFIAGDESGNFALFEKDDPLLSWADTTVSQRRLRTGDLNKTREVDVADFGGGYAVVYDSIFDVNRLFDITNAINPINMEPQANAGFDITTTSFDGEPIRAFLNSGGTTDLDYDETLSAEWNWDGGSATGLQTFVNLPVDVTSVELTITDSKGAISRDSIAVSIQRPPVIENIEDVVVIDADGDGLIQRYLNPVSDRPDQEIASWNWRWPGGTLSSKSGIITLGPEAYDEFVTLEVVDINGLSSETTFKFTLLVEDPTPDILLPVDGASLDAFGSHVAIESDTALIGAPDKQYNGVRLGATYLAENTNNAWQQISLDPQTEQGTAVALDTEYAFVGGGQDDGSVRVYRKQSGIWTLLEVIPNQLVDNERFGTSVARDGDYLVVGAPEANIPGSFSGNEGAVYIYELQTDGTWDLFQTVYPETGDPFSPYERRSGFGTKVAIKGDYLSITSTSFDGNLNSGRVYIYERGLTQWDRVAVFSDPEGDEDSYGRYSLVMNETEVLVGARSDNEFVDSFTNGLGAVYRYTLDPSLGWQANGKIYPPASVGSSPSFGESLGLHDNVLLVGAPRDLDVAKGSVSIYSYDSGDFNFVKVQQMTTAVDSTTPSFPYFAASVDHDGDDMIVGASRGQNASGVGTGKAYVYRNLAALNNSPLKNEEPIADAGTDINVTDTITRDTVEPFPILEPLGSEPVMLDASATIDNENAIASYEWSWAGGSAFGINPTARFPVGTTTVTLTVIDDQGIVNSDTVDVTVSLAQSNPATLPDVSGNSLTVDLPVSGALWRLSSEFLWHADNTTLNNVELGETYQLEILGFAGSTETITTFVTVDSANTVSTLNVTLPIQPATTGTIRFPETEQGFSWRLAGESTWRDVADNGDEVEDLIAFSVPTGPIRIEFKPVLGYATPQTRILNISSSLTLGLNWGEYLRINNFDSSKTFDLVSSPNLAADPFQYIGMIRTPLGRGTGTVVADRVVLTAAHLFFDFNGLQWSDVQWFPRQQEGTRQAAPVLPRGILYRTSYAKLVAPDSVEGAVANLPEDDQEVDYAVLYFSNEGTWDGGSANFLQSTAERNWLTGSEAKHAAGYPQRSQPYPDRGKIFEKTFSAALSPLDSKPLPLLYESSEVFGDGGGSGSALFVQPQGGSQFYPAAVLLAGQGRGVYHVIDGDVTRMIKDGEDAASGNDEVLDNNSSLVTYQNLGGLTTLSVDISPGAVLSNARWTVTPNAGTGFANLLPTQQVPFNPAWDSFTISFSAVSGFATPSPVFLLNSEITLGGSNTIPATYEPLSGFDDWLQANSIADPLDDGDGDNRVALLEYATDGSPSVADFLEVVRVVETPSGDFAQYEVYVSSDADAILYEVKAVSDLADRSDPSKVELLATFDRSFGTGYQTVTDSKSFTEASSRFVWVEVTHDRSISSQ